MPNYVYDRAAVPVGEILNLDTQFTDVAGNAKDADAYPTVSVLDDSGATTRVASASSVRRIGVGLYRLQYTVPDGYTSGTWSDTWVGAVDGYSITATFNFEVSSVGNIEAVNTVVEAEMALGYGLWYFIKQRNGQAQLVKSHSDELKKLQLSHAGKLDEVHLSYRKQISDLHTDRINDIKEMSEDYAALAEKTNEVMSRLNFQLEIRGNR